MARAEDWPWSSLGSPQAATENVPQITAEEMLRRGDWTEFVNAPMTEAEADAIRLSIRRNRPFGKENWTRATVASLGLESSIRSPGGQRHGDNLAQTT